MRDITTKNDIVDFVNAFYDKVMRNELLSPFFKNLNFEKHLPKMVDFWAFVLLDQAGYTTNVTDKHMQFRLTHDHFEQWISLFNGTLDELFAGEKVEMAKQRAALIGWTIENKLNSKH
jgi:hemoglobin